MRTGLFTLSLVLLAAAPLRAEPVVTGNAIEGVRNARYCEIIPVTRKGFRLTARVYNTIGHSDCPPALWNAITEEAMKQRFDTNSVLLNGPRFFTMDSIAAGGDTKTGETIDIGGLKLTERATVDLGLLDLLNRSYREIGVDRVTIYTFKAGQPVFMLSAADGSRYAMQSYAQIVDKTLTYADLPKLGERLKLPSGWRYSATVPDRDLVVGANGAAIVIQDELENTYQKLD